MTEVTLEKDRKEHQIDKIKKGKLLISHRYNHLPLLSSKPGGFSRSWSYKTYPMQMYNFFLFLQKFSDILWQKEVYMALQGSF